MISGKDITIDKDGSIILNGDKYPLASQAEIDAVKDNIGDLTQTGLTGDSVAEQLATAGEQITNKIKVFSPPDIIYTCTSTNFEYTGASVTCPNNHTYIVRARAIFASSAPKGIIAANSTTTPSVQYLNYAASETAAYLTFMLTSGETAYIWAKWEQANKTNNIGFNIIDITN